MGQRARLAIYPSTPSLRLPVPLSPSILPCVRRYFAEPLSRRSALTIKSECLPAGDQTVTGIVVTVAFHPSIRRGEASALTARSPLLFSARREMADQATCLPTKSAVLLPMHQGDILGSSPSPGHHRTGPSWWSDCRCMRYSRVSLAISAFSTAECPWSGAPYQSQ